MKKGKENPVFEPDDGCQNDVPESTGKKEETQNLIPETSKTRRPIRPLMTRIDIGKLEEVRKKQAESKFSKLTDLVEEDWLVFSDTEKYKFSMNDLFHMDVLDPKVNSYYHLPSGKMIAIKFFNLRSDEVRHLEKRKREVEINHILRNSNRIVQFYGIARHNGQVLLCMELMDASLTGLYAKVHKKYGYFPPDLLINIIIEVIKALIFCDSEVFMNGEHKRISHRDIKPHNILIDKQGHVKLADFGESIFLINDSFANTFSGTLWYMAPERFEKHEGKERYRATSSDIWSLAITLCEMILGRLPFEINEAAHLAQSDDFFRYILAKNNVKGVAPEEILRKCEEFVMDNPVIDYEEREEYCLIFDFLNACFERRLAEKPYEELRKTDLFQKYCHDNETYIEDLLEKYEIDFGPDDDHHDSRRLPSTITLKKARNCFCKFACYFSLAVLFIFAISLILSFLLVKDWHHASPRCTMTCSRHLMCSFRHGHSNETCGISDECGCRYLR